ncbi:hypothetical protein BGZ88_004173 [Linnemannia elongata]|nr:hypothetical protein BGZ88_004173 [Linnemannia elongata]
MVRNNNPIWCLLSKTFEQPKAFELAEVLSITASANTNWKKTRISYSQSGNLTDPTKHYSEIALELFRELAYIPVRDRDYIVNHHKIAHPYKFHWRFWEKKPRELQPCHCQSQVLQVTSTPTVDHSKYIISRDIYQATFDMLWLKSGSDSSRSEDSVRRGVGKGLCSWPFAVWALAQRQPFWTPNPTVECHFFMDETLDNPAIAALVEYKWNTIGLQYWLLCLLVQCVYYVLVLVGVVLQINGYDNMAILKNIFFVIFAMSTYIRTPCGRAARVRVPNGWKSPAIISIRPQYAELALQLLRPLHLLTLHCPSYTEGFSLGFFRVFSMTYFMMGGRYDPVSNGFSNNDVGFHVMMMVFFFFTVILMLNVLIALINQAVEEGDRTWELDWLNSRMRFIEGAENFTLSLPGFRMVYDCFPETIYFTAAPLQVHEYKEKTQRILDGKFKSVDPTNAAEFTAQQPISGNMDGAGSGGRILDRQQQSRQEQEGESPGKGAEDGVVLALLKQFQEDQKLAMEDQRLAREEQQRVYEELRIAHEEQRQAAADLRKELALLKERVGQ